MIVLKETATPQEFFVIPREYAADRIEIYSETNRTTASYDITATLDGYYLTWTQAVTLKEENFYMLTVYNGVNVVYTDKIFCTNQTVSTYSRNNGEFITRSSSNEYITRD